MRYAKVKAMKKAIGISILLFLLLFLGATASPSLAKDYRWTQVLVEAEVLPDGTLQVTETRSLRFEGNYHFAYIEIEHKQIQGVDQVSVEENGQPYQQSTTEGPGTFSVTDNISATTIRWNYDYTDSERTWTIRYRILGAPRYGAIGFYADMDQLYFQFIGAAHDKTMDLARVTLRLPVGAGQEELRVWGYGPMAGSGDVKILDDRTVQLTAQPLWDGEFLEARLLFPSGLVQKPADITRSTQAILPQVLSEQQAQDAADRWRRIWLDLQYGLAIAVALLVPLLMFTRWWTKGKELRLPPATAMISGPPSGLAPAAVDILWRQSATQKGLIATVFDLAHRGYLQMEQVAEGDFRLLKLKEADADLKPFENSLLGQLFGWGETSVLLSSLAHQLASSLSRLQKQARSYLEPFHFFDGNPAQIRGFYSMIGSLMFLAGIGLFWLQVFQLGIGLLFASFFVFGFGIVMPRRSITGAREYAGWKAFEKYMLELEKRPELKNSTRIFSEYLPYAVVFGIEQSWISSFVERPSFAAPPWWLWVYAATYQGTAGGPSDFGRTLQHSFADFTSRVSTAFAPQSSNTSGGGGGFSGGGGGGGGGGGSGAG
jgi:uncharacterized membrane protein